MKRSPLRKQSPRPERIAYRKAWTTFGNYIKARDGYRCITCGTINGIMQAGHYKHDVLDFDEININCQCSQCNGFYNGRLDRYGDYIRKKYGADEYRRLIERASFAKKGRRYYEWELKAIAGEYDKKLRELQCSHT